MRFQGIINNANTDYEEFVKNNWDEIAAIFTELNSVLKKENYPNPDDWIDARSSVIATGIVGDPFWDGSLDKLICPDEDSLDTITGLCNAIRVRYYLASLEGKGLIESAENGEFGVTRMGEIAYRGSLNS